jgi:surface antigen
MIDGRISAVMRAWNVTPWLLGLSVLAGSALAATPAFAKTKTETHSAGTTHHVTAQNHAGSKHLASNTSHHHTSSTRHGSVLATKSSTHHRSHTRLAAAHYKHSWLQCVPYAREVSHIQLTGNAFLWWAEAAGRYARGNAPVTGAVLNFRAIHRMPLGHVAVVTAVIDDRTILVTQANWIRGTITNDVTVQDVSANNDWSQVEVELGDTSTWGAPYPTYGFIYNRPDIGTTIASTGPGTPSTEVAEAPKPTLVSNDAPNRNLQ